MAGSRRSLRAMKASGQLRLTTGRRLISPPSLTTRPTTSRVRESIMNILAARLNGSRWLDLCCGSGVIGCEALERGAAAVIAVDRDSRCTKICERNLQLIADALNTKTELKVICSDLLILLEKGWSSDPFDVVYFDPPYESGLYDNVLNLLSEGNWIHPDGIVVCEHRSTESIHVGDQWVLKDQRRYGSSSLMMLSRPELHHVDTGSRQRQTGREELRG